VSILPNGHEKKEYGKHCYEEHRGSHCTLGCGCWASDARSGGPLGLDPFGVCPNNPIDGVLRTGSIDYMDVVEQRIEGLQQRAFNAENLLKQVAPGTIELAKKLAEVRREKFSLEQKIKRIIENANK